MIPEFVVVFREAFEISLIVGIMLAFLRKSGNAHYEKFVYAGVLLAFAASLLSSVAFSAVQDAFQANEALFEGVTLVLTALLVTWLVAWLARNENASEFIRAQLKQHLSQGKGLGVLVFAFIAVFREGIEIMLFLAGISVSTGALNYTGALLGAVAALVLGFLVFSTLVRLNYALFFRATAVILIILAAGLLSQGVHELEEAHVLPILVEHVYDFTPALGADGQPVWWAEKGAVGGVLKGMMGYDLNPSLSQIVAYFAYVILALTWYFSISSPAKKSASASI